MNAELATSYSTHFFSSGVNLNFIVDLLLIWQHRNLSPAFPGSKRPVEKLREAFACKAMGQEILHGAFGLRDSPIQQLF